MRGLSRTSLALLLALAPLGARAEEKGPVVVAPSARRGPAASSKRVALLVGVDRFDDARWPGLRFPDEDARRVAAALMSVSFDTTLVVDPERTDRAGVLGAIDELAGRVERPDDVVVVYLSTHGTLAASPRGGVEQVLVLRDTDHEKALHTGLPLRDLFARFDAVPSKRKVLILATCYSGTGKSSVSEALERQLQGVKGALAPPLYEVSDATIVLSAASWGEAAREDERLGHDIYTHFFLDALSKGYDPDGDGATSVTEAHDYARRETYRFSGGAQRPTALIALEGEDPIVLAGQRRSGSRPVLSSYRAGLDGARVIVDGTAKGELPGTVVVEPGWHEIAVIGGSSGEELVRRTIRLSPDDRIDLDSLAGREAPNQIELHGIGWLRSGSPRGSERVLLGGAEALVRWQELLFGVDLSLRIGAGLGPDDLVINQERFSALHSELRGAIGLGTHLNLGTAAVLHLDLFAGGGAFRRTVDSAFFEDPATGAFGAFTAAAAIRFRVSHAFSIGAGGEAGATVGDQAGPAGGAWISGALSL